MHLVVNKTMMLHLCVDGTCAYLENLMHSFKYNGFHTPASPKHSGTIPSKSVRLKQATMFVSREQGAVVLFSIEGAAKRRMLPNGIEADILVRANHSNQGKHYSAQHSTRATYRMC